jgi:hypothetical protein
MACKPLSDHVELSEFIDILLKNSPDQSDRYLKANLWQAIESSTAFSSDDFIMSVNDDYLTAIDVLIETYGDFLFNFIKQKSGIDIFEKNIKGIQFNSDSLIIQL